LIQEFKFYKQTMYLARERLIKKQIEINKSIIEKSEKKPQLNEPSIK